MTALRTLTEWRRAPESHTASEWRDLASELRTIADEDEDLTIDGRNAHIKGSIAAMEYAREIYRDERDSLVLSAPSAADAAAATDITRARASQIRTAAGISSPTGRPPSPTSTRSLQALGSRVVVDAAAVGLGPVEYLDAAQAAVDGAGLATLRRMIDTTSNRRG